MSGQQEKVHCREFKMTTELGGYDMDGVMLDLGSDVNIFPNKSWEVMGKHKLVWSPIQLFLIGQSIQDLPNRSSGASGSKHRRSENKG
jgi:hypothetical protein